MRIVLVHGFNVRDFGKRSVDRLAPWFENWGFVVDTDEADYGWFGLLSVRLFKQPAIDRITNALRGADIVVTHSNGAYFTNEALKQLDEPHRVRVFHLSPALNRRTKLPPAVKRCVVFCSRRDWAVKLAALVPFSKWGSMGAYGPISTDQRYACQDWTDSVEGHSDWFTDENRYYVAAEIERLIHDH